MRHERYRVILSGSEGSPAWNAMLAVHRYPAILRLPPSAFSLPPSAFSLPPSAFSLPPSAFSFQGRKNKGPGEAGDLRLNEPSPDRVADQSGRRVDVQLLHHFHPMRLRGLRRNTEDEGDLFRRVSFGDQLQNEALTIGQRVER